LFGVLGGFDWTLTLRELVQAAQGREKSQWSRTSLLACILANANRDPAKQRRPFTPADFDPYRVPASKGARLTQGTLRLFATAISTLSANSASKTAKG
jgi:hypothetical protein